jgi:hypothetical protein
MFLKNSFDPYEAIAASRGSLRQFKVFLKNSPKNITKSQKTRFSKVIYF